MATIILTAVGTAIGGPIGATVGAIIGQQIDSAIFKPSTREGARLKELSVTSSSYGTPIARHFGTMRAAGSIIWATDLVESSEKVGGGKNTPSTKTYSYSTSFAVAIASRPILSVGRIWADGNLLRGAAGDLKTGGELRIYLGHGDQQPDPLLLAAEGPQCPAFRGIAYVVFETLQLADFGNRMPALTFEITADDGQVELVELVLTLQPSPAVNRPLDALVGFSDEGGPVGVSLATINTVYPLACDTAAAGLQLFAPDIVATSLPMLPEAAIGQEEEDYGAHTGQALTRKTAPEAALAGLRYYDVDRDYQAGLQLVGGRSQPGGKSFAEFPGALAAGDALQLAEQSSKRERSGLERIAYRLAEIDPSLTPGAIVSLPERAGAWRIESWEWRTTGIELELARLPSSLTPFSATEAGRALSPVDLQATPTLLMAYELPWDGLGSSGERQVYAAVSSVSSGWTGAMLYAEQGGALVAIEGSGAQRSVIGETLQPLAAGSPTVIDRATTIEVQLASPDFSLLSLPVEDLAAGSNRAVIGTEIIQFACATNLGGGRWELSHLLRGRGGTEAHALSGHSAGEAFVLLDDLPVRLDIQTLGAARSIAAIGLADTSPATAKIIASGRTTMPFSPVHPRATYNSAGDLQLCWTRRARGAWQWAGTVEPALIEESEAYEVGLGEPDNPLAIWQASQPSFGFDATTLSQLFSTHGAAPLWVRQIGTYARSPAVLLTHLS